jgi:hypothetical protein
MDGAVRVQPDDPALADVSSTTSAFAGPARPLVYACGPALYIDTLILAGVAAITLIDFDGCVLRYQEH